MTIDEIIQKYKKSSEFYKDTTNYRYSIELEQIVDWLEELKELRNHVELTEIPNQYKLGFQDGYSTAENDYFKKNEEILKQQFDNGEDYGYNKAIDDVIKKCEEMSSQYIDTFSDYLCSGLDMAVREAEGLRKE